ncbi:AI-2E family transporter [Rhodomicrobium sp. Az07]|uniref:AI-2E family transporter n=1 Tax=Rhodomicrobium sp. Az07 TaxID=2839034 RepID=UPI001BE7C900|nr:AI-2E family transporter [Rhodomicrobium sp. Az07]MBT3070173.1 AI-2E family transporter [Rhodomicrobium sp. Az07]
MDNTIRLSPHGTFWLVIVALGAIGLMVFADVLMPFAAGFVLAYLFHPLVDRLNRIGVHRGAAAFAIIAVLSLVFVAIFALLIPPLVDQLRQFAQDLPVYYQRARAYLWENYPQYLRSLQSTVQQQEGGAAGQAQDLAGLVAGYLKGLAESSLAFFNTLALLFLTPIITFFLLRDWDQMFASIDSLLPKRDAPTIRKLAGEVDDTISGYLRGMFIVLSILSIFYMVSLGLIGLNYGLLIGLFAGLISFVPYLGSTTGLLVAGGVALAQFAPDYSMVALVVGVFIFGQIIEGNVLTPNIVGNQVRLHPVWLLFALVAAGYLLGFTGLLISVPLAAVIGVLVRFALRKYQESEIYDEENSEAAEEAVEGAKPRQSATIG